MIKLGNTWEIKLAKLACQAFRGQVLKQSEACAVCVADVDKY